MTIAPAAGFYPSCVRSAWLDLYGDGTVTVPLENAGAGYFCSSLDLGSPVVRAVTTNRPDTDGEDDRTQYLGGRVVTVALSAYAGAGAQMDAVPGLFARFMAPAARPILHYVLNRPGTPERTLTVRAAAFAWPIAGPEVVNVQLQFEAADPAAYDPTARLAANCTWARVIGP
jgi:hypothetical protein